MIGFATPTVNKVSSRDSQVGSDHRVRRHPIWFGAEPWNCWPKTTIGSATPSFSTDIRVGSDLERTINRVTRQGQYRITAPSNDPHGAMMMVVISWPLHPTNTLFRWCRMSQPKICNMLNCDATKTRKRQQVRQRNAHGIVLLSRCVVPHLVVDQMDSAIA